MKVIRERYEQIGDKEGKIYDSKQQNQELEKFKLVLDYKIKELKAQIDPKGDAEDKRLAAWKGLAAVVEKLLLGTIRTNKLQEYMTLKAAKKNGQTFLFADEELKNDWEIVM